MRIYLSPSNQEHNVGKGAYGTEEKQMHALAAKVARLLKARGFQTRISQPQWSMAQVVADSNGWKADAHVCMHTNAGGGDGTVAFYGSAAGKALTKAIYDRVAPLSPGADEGLKSWPGLYEIAHTIAPCAYLELFFHDNHAEVADYLADEAAYAEGVARGICDWAKVPWTKPEPGVDYRPLKKAAVKVANTLGIPHENVIVTVNAKGAAFEKMLRAIADHKEKA
jgi:N-acetylmuramoyl-L-alanine amidase